MALVPRQPLLLTPPPHDTQFLTRAITSWNIEEFARAVRFALDGRMHLAVQLAASQTANATDEWCMHLRSLMTSGNKEFADAKARDEVLADVVNRLITRVSDLEVGSALRSDLVIVKELLTNETTGRKHNDDIEANAREHIRLDISRLQDTTASQELRIRELEERIEKMSERRQEEKEEWKAEVREEIQNHCPHCEHCDCKTDGDAWRETIAEMVRNVLENGLGEYDAKLHRIVDAAIDGVIYVVYHEDRDKTKVARMQPKARAAKAEYMKKNGKGKLPKGEPGEEPGVLEGSGSGGGGGSGGNPGGASGGNPGGHGDGNGPGHGGSGGGPPNPPPPPPAQANQPNPVPPPANEPDVRLKPPQPFNGNDTTHTIRTWLRTLNSYFDNNHIHSQDRKLRALLGLLGRNPQGTLEAYYEARDLSLPFPGNYDQACELLTDTYAPINEESLARTIVTTVA